MTETKEANNSIGSYAVTWNSSNDAVELRRLLINSAVDVLTELGANKYKVINLITKDFDLLARKWALKDIKEHIENYEFLGTPMNWVIDFLESDVGREDVEDLLRERAYNALHGMISVAYFISGDDWKKYRTVLQMALDCADFHRTAFALESIMNSNFISDDEKVYRLAEFKNQFENPFSYNSKWSKLYTPQSARH